MCNTNKNEVTAEDATITLLLYRLDRLENEQRKENQSIMRMLTKIQENQLALTEKITIHHQELNQVNARLKNLEKGKVGVKEFKTECNNITDRINTYKQLLMVVGGGVIASLALELIKLI